MFEKTPQGEAWVSEASYCGLYCGACELFIATRNGTLDALSRQRGVSANALHCDGCKGTQSSCYCTHCAIKSCARDKGVAVCIDCAEYPCADLAAFRNDGHAHKKVIFRNLRFIEQEGLPAWLDAQNERWRCRACFTRSSYYQTTCTACGASLHDCEAEAQTNTETD